MEEEEKKFLFLSDIAAYRISLNLSNYIWDIVVDWEWFAKKTIGSQFVNATDSISPNIAEGFGRYHKKDKIKFYRYSQGSIKECYDWNVKAKYRKLISEETYNYILGELKRIEPTLGWLIKYTNEKLKI